jgi:hypothetical protein
VLTFPLSRLHLTGLRCRRLFSDFLLVFPWICNYCRYTQVSNLSLLLILIHAAPPMLDRTSEHVNTMPGTKVDREYSTSLVTLASGQVAVVAASRVRKRSPKSEVGFH